MSAGRPALPEPEPLEPSELLDAVPPELAGLAKLVGGSWLLILVVLMVLWLVFRKRRR